MPLRTLKWSPICFRFQLQIPSHSSCTWWSIGVYLEDKRYGQEEACRIVGRLSLCICPSRSSYDKNNNNVATYWKLYCNFIAVWRIENWCEGKEKSLVKCRILRSGLYMRPPFNPFNPNIWEECQIISISETDRLLWISVVPNQPLVLRASDRWLKTPLQKMSFCHIRQFEGRGMWVCTEPALVLFLRMPESAEAWNFHLPFEYFMRGLTVENTSVIQRFMLSEVSPCPSSISLGIGASRKNRTQCWVDGKDKHISIHCKKLMQKLLN